MALKVCSTPGCHELVQTGRCEKCGRTADKNRGNSGARGYGHRHQTNFRARVLARNPICVLCRQAPATIADHHPHSRKELVRLHLDPDNPAYGRGLCKPCHDRETAIHQPGGWNDR